MLCMRIREPRMMHSALLMSVVRLHLFHFVTVHSQQGGYIFSPQCSRCPPNALVATPKPVRYIIVLIQGSTVPFVPGGPLPCNLPA
ncbi:hypothetical protein HDV57DRAFT_483552 [Trichoderma longibrachiatum]